MKARIAQVFGGLVWILVASTLAAPQNPLGWVMAVSVFCFVATFLWSFLFLCGCHSNKSRWAAAVSTGAIGELISQIKKTVVLITP